MNPIIDGLRTTVIGMGIVFFVLIVLSLVVWSFKFFNKLNTKFIGGASINASPKIPVTEKVENDDDNDAELVAVIAAAIAASLNKDVSKLKIRSIRKINDNYKWIARSRAEQQTDI